ncbi:MAG: hypothetical protein ACQESG_03985 [Nanobdellota archaeon]
MDRRECLTALAGSVVVLLGEGFLPRAWDFPREYSEMVRVLKDYVVDNGVRKINSRGDCIHYMGDDLSYRVAFNDYIFNLFNLGTGEDVFGFSTKGITLADHDNDGRPDLMAEGRVLERMIDGERISWGRAEGNAGWYSRLNSLYDALPGRRLI